MGVMKKRVRTTGGVVVTKKVYGCNDEQTCQNCRSCGCDEEACQNCRRCGCDEEGMWV